MLSYTLRSCGGGGGGGGVLNALLCLCRSPHLAQPERSAVERRHPQEFQRGAAVKRGHPALIGHLRHLPFEVFQAYPSG